MNRTNRCCALALALVVLLPVAAPAALLFETTLSGAQQVPPTPSGGTGFASLLLNDAMTEVIYHVDYQALDGIEGAAHFHNAGPGQNGPVFLTLPLGTPKDGVWAVTPFQVAELLAGRVYVNIHTDLYAAGEIRGDFTQHVVAGEAATWGGLRSLYR